VPADDKLTNRHVCADCFGDDPIRRFVRDHVVSGMCDFCGRQSDGLVAAPWEDVLRFILDGLESCWTTNIYESVEDPEDEFQHSYDTRQLIESVSGDGGVPPIRNESVIEEVLRSTDALTWYNRALTSRDPYGGLVLSWGDFRDRVMRKSRFFFHVPMRGDDANLEPPEMPTAKILDELGEIVRRGELVRTLSSGTRFFRARQHSPDHPVRSAFDLGPPPRKNRKALCANRMSPAGIVMFYGASDQRTALREVYDPRRANDEPELTVGQFVTTTDFGIVDLTNVPPVPSIFDRDRRTLRSGIMFLHRFVEEVKLRVTKDGTEHLEYVPTQVVTEYFRHVFKAADGSIVRGILYPSSIEDGGDCCVLFFEADQCSDQRGGRFDQRSRCLQLDTDSIEHFSAEPNFVSSGLKKRPDRS